MTEFVRNRWQAIVLAAVAIVFILQNRADTRVQFLWMDLTAPMWLTLTAVTLVGIVIGMFVTRRNAARKKGV